MSVILSSTAAIFSGAINVLNALGTPLTLYKEIKDNVHKKQLQEENISVKPISDILAQPELIMGASGRITNGFNAGIYITRDIDDAIKQSIEKKPCTIITGRAGSGKSRAVYQYLLGQENIFEKVVIIKRESLTCDMQQLQSFLRPYLKEKAKALIYIDDFRSVKGVNLNSGWELWESIVEDARQNKGKIVFLSRDKEDYEKGNIIEIAPITRNSPTHNLCKERFRSGIFSPIIGNYIERERVEGVIKIPSELLLISGHIFITHYFHRRGTQEEYLKKLYERLCDQLVTNLGKDEAQNLKDHFNDALHALKEKGILDANNRLTDELFASDLVDCLCDKKYTYTSNNVTPKDAVIYKCTLLTSNRSALSYIKEKELVKLLLSIDGDDIEPYLRAITRSTGQNTRRIAKFVQSKFDEHFVGQENKTSIELITKAISLIASRVYYGWEEIVNAYLKKYPSIRESNDLISEILRIATDDRTSQEEKKHAIDYIHQMLHISEEDLRERATKDVRIALNYERAQEDIDEKRIVNVLSLLLESISRNNDAFHNALPGEEQEKIKNDIHYILKDISCWTRVVSAKVSSYQQLDTLVKILKSHSKDLQRLKDKIKAAPKAQSWNENFTFLSYTSLCGIAHNIHKAYPIGYDKHYEKCIDSLAPLAKNDSYSHIADKNSFAGFLLTKLRIDNKKVSRGALAELKTFHQVHKCILHAQELSVIEKNKTLVYVAWLYRLFSVIKTTEDFETADAMLNKFLNAHSKYSIEGKRKLYNNLLSNAPWEQARMMVTEGQFLHYECDPYTISSLFKAAKNAFYAHSMNIYLYESFNAKVKSAIKIGEILETIAQTAQLSRNKNLKWEAASGTLLKGILRRLDLCIKQKEPESNANPKLRDYVAEHGQVGQYITALEELIHEIESSRTEATTTHNNATTSEITRTLDWGRLSVPDMKVKLTEIRQYFFEGVSNETGRTLISDQITHLIKHVNDMIKNTRYETGRERWNFEGDGEKEVAALLEDLVYEGKDGNRDKTLDAYIPVKFYYYTQVGEFLIYCVNPHPKDRLYFGLNALHHLYECGNPISENKEDAHNALNEKNIFEILLSDLSFDECAAMIEEIKKIAQVEIYNNVYTAKSIVMLCNKLKEGLSTDNENQKLLEKRINDINCLISDEDQLAKTGTVLFFDTDDAPRIASINTHLTKKNKNNPEEVFFPTLPSNIRINLPIASTKAKIRHAAWSMYEDQDCLNDIKTAALNLFLYRELEDICATLASATNDSPDLLAYYRMAMDLLHNETYLNKIADRDQLIKDITQNHHKLPQKYHLENDMKLLDAEPWIKVY